MSDSGPTSTVRVLLSLNAPGTTTGYVDQIAANMPSDVELSYFSWLAALTGRYDVFHVHWPEWLVRDDSRLKAWGKRQALRVLMWRLSILRVPVIRTVHNIGPHETGASPETRVLRKLEARTRLYIRLNDSTQLPHGVEAVTILHGHYREQFQKFLGAAVVPGRMLHFGIIRPYKGIDELLGAFRTANIPDTTLRIVGRSSSDELTGLIKGAESDDARVSSRLEYVDDATLVLEISKAEVVILPYKQMHNSGALLAALSVDRPVVVPASSANQILSAEAGDSWIIQYGGELTGRVLEEALTQVRNATRSSSPNLDARDWEVVADSHAVAYRRIARR